MVTNTGLPTIDRPLPASAQGWRQYNLRCTDWRTIERLAVHHFVPALAAAETRGDLSGCRYVRKGDTWRLRLQSRPGHHGAAVDDIVRRAAAQAAASGEACDVVEALYEPEVHAFGGEQAMRIAHILFHADSRHVLHHLANRDQADYRRELALILSSRLLCAAGLDWYEHGDVWAQIAAHRDNGNPDRGTPSPTTVTAVGRLIAATVDAEDSPLHHTPAWTAAFQQAGAALADLHAHGRLTRGLRGVLTHHVLFTLNRHGVSAADQHHLATAARTGIFDRPLTLAPTATLHADPDPSATADATDGTPPAADVDRRLRPACRLATPTTNTPGGRDAATVHPVTAPHIDAETTDPQQLRNALADHIRDWGTFQPPAVEAAFRTVPRELFLPGVDLDTAYRPKPVVTKRAGDGSSVSSASSPRLVAAMLEQLQVQAGHRVMEIGAATGINAALLAELTGPAGQVVTIELDQDLAAGARTALARAGYPHVQVICGDGALGHPAGAPYDRIIVTAEAWDLPAAFWDQLSPTGRLVVPVRLHGSGLTRAIGLQRTGPDVMVSHTAQVCGFVPMRGSSEHTDHGIALADGIAFGIDTADQPDQAALARALTHPAHQVWTGIRVHDNDPAEHLDLWLATADTAPAAFGRLAVTASARAAGLADPAMRWAGASLYHGGTIAYIAARPVTDEINELGVIGHGPHADDLADQTAAALHRWNQQRPGQPTITAYRAGTPTTQQAIGGATIRPTTILTVSW